VRRDWRVKGSGEQWHELNHAVQYWIDQCPPERQAQFECRELIVKPGHDWKQAVIEQLVITECAYKAEHETNPALAIQDLIAYHLHIERTYKPGNSPAVAEPVALTVPSEVMEAAEHCANVCLSLGESLSDATAAKVVNDWLKSLSPAQPTGGIAE
jgi:hypothetical protein